MNLISTENFVEAPFVIVKIGAYSFGTCSYKGAGLGGGERTLNVSFPNFITSLNVTKISGKVNTYTLNMVYAITENDDPNMFEKVFSSVKDTREMVLTYGDWNSPANIYKEESALITSIKSKVSLSSSKIDYTISGVSNAFNLDAASYDFPERNAKPSDIIKEILYSSTYGMQKVFTGMINKKDVNNNNLIASDDKKVHIPAKASVSTMGYLSYLVEHMDSMSSKNDASLKDCVYQFGVVDDSTNQFGGPYFKVRKINSSADYSTADNAWEIDVGFPGKNFVMDFDIENDESWSILYDYQDKIPQSSYTYRIDNEGNMLVEESPSIMRSKRTKVVNERTRTWWSQMTQFPITATLTIKGLVRPTLIMDYVKLNVLFYGQRHISSGVYVITKQEDSISGSGYRTKLTLLRVREDYQ